MSSKGSGNSSSLPSYLEGTLLLRGRTRWIWTGFVVAVFMFVLQPVEHALGKTAGAPVALLAFPIAWMWGGGVGLVAAAAGYVTNFIWARHLGMEGSLAAPMVFDALAIMAIAFLVGHASRRLEMALGARHQADEAYSQLEQTARDRMFTITDQVPVGLYRTTPGGRVVGGNSALMKILGFADQAALLDANVWDLYVDSEERLSQIEASNRAAEGWREFELRRADGEIIWVRDWAAAVVDHEGNTEHFDGVLEDITEQRLAAARFRAAFEDAPIGMSIAGLDGRIVRANAAVADLLGYPIEELEGLHFSEYSFEEDLDATRDALSRLSAGEIVRYEKRIVRRDGTALWVMVNLAPIYEGADKPTHLISHVVDLTERKNAQEALEHLVRSKDELIASVSHELRTPLTVVHGLAQELDASAKASRRPFVRTGRPR